MHANRVLPVVNLLLVSACAGSTASGTSTSASSTSSSSSSSSGAACERSFAPAPLHLEQRTEAWGLAALEVQGNRIITPDLDGDGYPDLVVNRGAPHRRADFTADRKTWPYRVLMNRPDGNGGRHFEEATRESGYAQVRGSAGPDVGRAVAFAVSMDADNDGDWDLFTGTYVDPSNPGTDPGDRSEILLNDGTGHFSLAPALPAVMRGVLTTSAATVADVDRDGRQDLYVGNWYERYGASYLGQQNRLLLGNGDGTFLDGIPGSGLATNNNFNAGTNHRPSYGVTACDVDGDGATDLMVSAYGRQLNQFWLQRDGYFTDVGVESGLASDDNTDFSDNENYKCHCAITRTCTAPTPQVQCGSTSSWSDTDELPWRLGGNTFTTVCADLDNDGDMDMYNAEIAHWWAGSSSDKSQVLRQVAPVDGIPRFERLPPATNGTAPVRVGVDWNEGGLMAAAADLDHNGLQDLVVAFSDYPDQYGLLFLQQPDGTYVESGELAGMRHPCLSGLSLADLDADGDLDVLAGAGTARDCAALWPGGAQVHVYENTTGNQGGWIQFRLEGDPADTSNATGVGARITVRTADGRAFTRELQTGQGHAGMNHDNVVHVGTGDACVVDVTVRWPNQALTVQEFAGLQAGHRYLLRQPDGTAAQVDP